METSSSASEHGLDDLDPATTPARDAVHFRRTIAARTALDITRQAAQQRFGRS